MTDNQEQFPHKQLKTVFNNEGSLPTHYVNIVNVRAGLEEFFLTFGTAMPLEITDTKELDTIDTINAHPLFRCAVSRSVMKQLIDLMSALYENQTEQIQQLEATQRQGGEYDNSDNRLA